MMKVLIILAHPDLHSFNHAIAKTCEQRLADKGHQVILHDLYLEKFDPILEQMEIPRNGNITPVIKMHCDELQEADGIIVVHPNWWGQPPAIMKGWIDRVLRPGIAYEFNDGDSGEGIPRGLLKAGIAIVFNTSNTVLERELSVFKDPLETLWKNCIFDFCGIKQFYRRMFSIMVASDEQQRDLWLEEVKTMIDNCFSPGS